MRETFNTVVAASVILAALLFVWSVNRSDISRSNLPSWHHDSKVASERVVGENRVDHEWLSGLHEPPASTVEEEIVETAITGQPITEETSNKTNPPGTLETVSNTEGFAYAFYATTDLYACSVLVNIHRLQHDLASRLPIHVLASTAVSQSYLEAIQGLGVSMHIESPPPIAAGGGGYYTDCLLKLLAFKLHRLSPGLKRVLVFDADQLIMRNMDILFNGLPAVDLAAPRAYWLAKDFLASTFLMISLSDRLWETVNASLATIGYNQFDMDIINDLLGEEVMMLSGEFVTLNSHWEDWNMPRWYHPEEKLNMTTIERVNALARLRLAAGSKKREIGIPDNGLHVGAKTANSPNLTLTITNGTVASSKPPLPAPVGIPSHESTLNPEPPLTVEPRFPEGHPLFKELVRLNDAAAVIHFSAVGKPWMISEATLRIQRPDAHPVLLEQFTVWRKTATIVCPSAIEGDPSFGPS